LERGRDYHGCRSQREGLNGAGSSAITRPAFASARAPYWDLQNSAIVASDAPIGKTASTQEMLYGAGAAAFTLGVDGVIDRLVGRGSVTINFVDHFRASRERFDYFWEDRWIAMKAT
jgi:3-hydroxy-3-methylglutaryl CoA synthase